MVRGKLRGGLGLGTEGVYPGMKLHATAVTLFNHKLQRVPVLIGGLTLQAGQIGTPRLQIGFIQGIGLNTDLEKYGVQTATGK
ncbi:MAG: hypothetical protein BWY95_01895 [Bacteroidetes bacterium ADurb.BinA104]|nr:MAG: hypothetical protein BWY95_01895 [Bacteroidetes bacterium ADurb.BinA104]